MHDEVQPPSPHAEDVQNHWWWRQGWSIGRRYYTWHLTFEGLDELHELVHTYQEVLASVPDLDLVPQQWLHLTMQGVGFTHETRTKDVDRIIAAATMRLRRIEPPRLTFHRAVVLPTAIALLPSPAEPIWEIRRAIRDGIAEVWGDEHVAGPAEEFRPHVSIAYNAQDRPAATLIEAVKSVQYRSVTVTVDNAALIVLNRDQRVYRWHTQQTVPLGTRREL